MRNDDDIDEIRLLLTLYNRQSIYVEILTSFFADTVVMTPSATLNHVRGIDFIKFVSFPRSRMPIGISTRAFTQPRILLLSIRAFKIVRLKITPFGNLANLFPHFLFQLVGGFRIWCGFGVVPLAIADQ